MKTTGTNKRLLASVLTTAMVFTMLPSVALAADDPEEKGLSNEETTYEAQPKAQEEESGVEKEEVNLENQEQDTKASANEQEQEDANSVKEQPAEGSEGTEPGESGGGTTENPEKPEQPEKPAEPAAYAAKIGTTEYGTLAEAVAAATAEEPIMMARDNTENITIDKSLTLDLGGYTLTGTGEGAVVTISGEGTQVMMENGTVTGGDNSGNGGGFAIANANVSMENLKIEDNKAAGTGGGTIGGGGIYAENAEVSLQKVTISGNEITKANNDGGGILVKNGRLTMNECKVLDNVSQDQGGGVLVVDTVLQLENSEVKNNEAKQGGGIFVDDSGKTERNIHNIVGTDIIGNEASNIGGGMYAGTYSRTTMQNCTLKKNICTDEKGQGGAIASYSAANLELIGVTVTENKAASGAGIFALTTVMQPESVIRLTEDTHVDDNEATGSGGGIYGYALSNESVVVSITVEGSSVSGNKANSGAGIFTYASSAKAAVKAEILSGGMVCNNAATVGYGGGIYGYNTAITVAEGGALYNNTAKAAGDDLFANGGTKLYLTNASEMGGERKLTADGKEITGWYHDGWYKWNPEAQEGKGGYEAIVRWAADANGTPYYDECTPAAGSAYSASLKAAHGLAYQVKYVVSGDIPEGYTAPAEKTVPATEKYTVEAVPASISGTKDGVNGTFSFAGWKTEDGKTLTGEQTLTGDVTLYGVWTFTKKSSGGHGGGGGKKPTVDIPDDVPTGLDGDNHFAYIIGRDDGKVHPEAEITRAEVATIFFRLLTEETRNANSTKVNNFSDVNAGSWYNHAISTLSSMGIVKGTPDGTFKPNASITRAEFAAIAARFDDKNTDTTSNFSDIASHWAKNEIGIAANKGWVNGYTDGTFRPNQNITRAEAMTLVNRVLNRLPETSEDLHADMIRWPDNQNTAAWYYLAVQEATNSHVYQAKSESNKYETWTALKDVQKWAELEH